MVVSFDDARPATEISFSEGLFEQPAHDEMLKSG
jgi:hypothetical protein